MKNTHEKHCPWHGIDLNDDKLMYELDGATCLCKNKNDWFCSECSHVLEPAAAGLVICPSCGHHNPVITFTGCEDDFPTGSIKLIVGGISSFSDDKQFQERLAIEISNRFAYQAQDAWKKYVEKNQHRYKDYTLAHLSKTGYEWRLNWMVNKMADNMARITATLTDLLGIVNDLRALSKAKSPDEMASIAGDLMERPGIKREAD